MARLQDWSSQEIHYSAFDDCWHGKRVQEVVRCLSKHPGQSVPQAASESKSQSQSIYRLWANKRVKPEQIRASHHMSVGAAVLGQMNIEIPRNPERVLRTACLTVRAMAVKIEVPRHHKQRSKYQPIQLNIILVEEVNPPQEAKPIRWLLLTTLPVETLAQVWQCVRWYSLRWLIERFHYTLKSGCKIEQLQLETKDRLLNALATYSIVAWRLMHLTYCARLHPEQSCEIA
ncbi:IS4 family transposase, partial [Chamaesiphon polymorphus]